MDIGMLWYDDTKRPLGEKIARAVEHYKTKYGALPTVCFVNPAMLPGGANGSGEKPEAAAGVQLRSARNVLINHFWIGVGEASTNGGHARNGKNGAKSNGTRRKK